MGFTNILAKVRRGLEQHVAEGQDTPVRCNNRKELMVEIIGKPRLALANEGSYFIASNPTPLTGVAGIATPIAYDAEEGFLTVYNDNSVGSGKRIILDKLLVATTVAGADGTDIAWVSKMNAGAKYVSGGALIAQVNPNSVDGQLSGAIVHAGALVTVAEASSVLVDSGGLRTVKTVVGDHYHFDFGGSPKPAGVVLEGTAQLEHVHPHNPVIINPGESFHFSVLLSAQTAASSFEFNLTWWER